VTWNWHWTHHQTSSGHLPLNSTHVHVHVHVHVQQGRHHFYLEFKKGTCTCIVKVNVVIYIIIQCVWKSNSSHVYIYISAGKYENEHKSKWVGPSTCGSKSHTHGNTTYIITSLIQRQWHCLDLCCGWPLHRFLTQYWRSYFVVFGGFTCTIVHVMSDVMYMLL
jgi:hypothetical protein